MKEFDITKLIKVGEIDNQDVYFEEIDGRYTAIFLNIVDDISTTVAYVTYIAESNGDNRIIDFSGNKNGSITALIIFLVSEMQLQLMVDTMFMKEWFAKFEIPVGGNGWIRQVGDTSYFLPRQTPPPKRIKGNQPLQTLQPMTHWFGNKNFL